MPSELDQAEAYLKTNPEAARKIALLIEPGSNGHEAPLPEEQYVPQREPGDDSQEVQAAAGEDADPESVAWPTLQPATLHGLAGEIVKTIEPHSEADPAALQTNQLVAFGNIVGRGPHFRVGGALHCTILFAVLVGLTAKGRKGLFVRAEADLTRRGTLLVEELPINRPIDGRGCDLGCA